MCVVNVSVCVGHLQGPLNVHVCVRTAQKHSVEGVQQHTPLGGDLAKFENPTHTNIHTSMRVYVCVCMYVRMYVCGYLYPVYIVCVHVCM